jgi:hypothetical protein
MPMKQKAAKPKKAEKPVWPDIIYCHGKNSAGGSLKSSRETTKISWSSGTQG